MPDGAPLSEYTRASTSDAPAPLFDQPALVIQADPFDELATVTVLPVTSTIVAAPLLRITVQPDAGNGLQKTAQVMVDKTMTVRRDKVGPVFGRLGIDALVEVARCLAVFLGIAK